MLHDIKMTIEVRLGPSDESGFLLILEHIHYVYSIIC